MYSARPRSCLQIWICRWQEFYLRFLFTEALLLTSDQCRVSFESTGIVNVTDMSVQQETECEHFSPYRADGKLVSLRGSNSDSETPSHLQSIE